MSDILFCGDTHGRFRHIIDAVKQHRPAAIIMDYTGPQAGIMPRRILADHHTDIVKLLLGSKSPPQHASSLPRRVFCLLPP
mgnify:CR=1 FL=1